MMDKTPFDENGVKVIARRNGKHGNMLMDVTVYHKKAGETLVVDLPGLESAILLVEGEVEFCWQNESRHAKRQDMFSENPACLHLNGSTAAKIRFLSESELIVQSTEAKEDFFNRYYPPEDITCEVFGGKQWEGTAKRHVRTVFDYTTAPYSNLVIGEVLNQPGRWSSYIPHSHPQPEIYYYRFTKPQGFGACFLGDEVGKITDGSASILTGEKTHPQCTAPGYGMYYCWMIRHLDGSPWTSRDNDPAHVWLLDV